MSSEASHSDAWSTIVKYVASLSKPVPPAVWKAIQSNQASLTPDSVKGILWGHGLKAPPAVRDAFVEISARTKKLPEPESELFQVNHIYSRSITNQIVSDASSECSDTDTDTTTTEYFMVTALADARGLAAEVAWLYSKPQLVSDLPDCVLRGVRVPLHASHFALSNHSQRLVAAELDDLADVGAGVAWGHAQVTPAHPGRVVVTHYVQVCPDAAPIIPVEQCGVFKNRAKIESASNLLSKMLMVTARNDVRPITAFYKSLEATTFDPPLQPRSYLACIFVESGRAKPLCPKPRYVLPWGGSASPWAVAIIKLCRYGKYNVPWASDEACTEFEAWCEALVVAKNQNEVSVGSATIALDQDLFGPSLFTNFTFTE